MFDRTSYKSAAKEKLRGTWFPTAAIITIIYFAVLALVSRLADKDNYTMSIVAFVLNIVVAGVLLLLRLISILNISSLSQEKSRSSAPLLTVSTITLKASSDICGCISGFSCGRSPLSFLEL